MIEFLLIIIVFTLFHIASTLTNTLKVKVISGKHIVKIYDILKRNQKEK